MSETDSSLLEHIYIGERVHIVLNVSDMALVGCFVREDEKFIHIGPSLFKITHSINKHHILLLELYREQDTPPPLDDAPPDEEDVIN